MDDFPKETPRFWIAFSTLCIAFALAFVMLVYTNVRAEAQQMPCSPLASLIDQLGEKYQEVIVWEGVMPRPDGPPAAAMLFQSPKGTWTMVEARGITACIMAVGEDATPIGGTGEEV